MSNPTLSHKIPFSRRRFLAFGGMALAGGLVAGARPSLAEDATPAPSPTAAAPGTFKAIPLPYAYDALMPSIDAETMHLHHDKHYAAYTKKLNDALEKAPELKSKSIEDLLSEIKMLPDAVRKVIRNNGGGFYNHTLFWQMMAPAGAANEPSGDLATAIASAFGSFKDFKTKFSEEASTIFGSGWAWLILAKDGSLKLTSTPNQDSPIMDDTAEVPGKPILGLDVWEHSYYLKYKNERPKYIAAWWEVVNWPGVEKFYATAKG